MNADVLRIQAELIRRGYLAAGQDDGIFGLITLDAVNHFRATLGKPPLGPSIKRVDIAELLLTLFPAEYAKPVSTSPLAILWALLPVFTKGTAMTSDQIAGLVRTLLAALASYAAGKGWIPGVSPELIATVATAVVGIWSWLSNKPKVITPIGK